MSELKATPGPWESKQHWGGGRLLIRKGCAQESLQIVPSEDAHLIAAAPELYECLAHVANVIEMANNGHPVPDNHDGEQWLKRTLEALAKARGESS